ncbi:hypothetical protein GCM10008106_10030 [Mongoliitalea lutea]|uniref:NodB homology domain-containing protein n=2 Tax=Mongoliitalea lutea TaxID=849756 RepID=A0A8J3CXK1_9BACT|nr:hypothetical protein GCM10008106_10030 [Mongoliitalea lutea]
MAVKDYLLQAEEHLKKPRIQFLYFHHLFKDEEQNFKKTLTFLAKAHEFISYSEAIQKILTNTIDKPYIVFSSDDGLKNNLRAAAILEEYGAVACFFINPSIIGERSYQKIEGFCKERLIFPTVDFMDWKDVEFLLKQGHEIGSHTMNHINIAEEPIERVREELLESKEMITKKIGEVMHFAYPYGRFFHFNEQARKLCFELGYQTVASAERGSHVNGPREITLQELCIRRDQVIFGWDMHEINFFLVQSARKACFDNSFFPYSR